MYYTFYKKTEFSLFPQCAYDIYKIQYYLLPKGHGVILSGGCCSGCGLLLSEVRDVTCDINTTDL